MTTEASTNPEQKQLADFLASHGGPFYELQARLHLLHARSPKVRSRSLIFVAVAWGMPFLLGLPDSLSLRGEEETYLTDFSAWARFFIAITAFILAEEQVERGLRTRLAQFVRAPLLAPESIEAAVAAVATALKERDSRLAEIVALILAGGAAVSSFLALHSADASSWAVKHSIDANTLTMAGWWSVCVSLPSTIFSCFAGCGGTLPGRGYCAKSQGWNFAWSPRTPMARADWGFWRNIRTPICSLSSA